MATATKTDDVYEKVLVSKGGVTLEMTNEEAEMIMSLIGRTVHNVPLQGVYNALMDAEVKAFQYTIEAAGATGPSIRLHKRS